MHLKRIATTGWTALAACFLLLLAVGCSRPSTSNTPPPPPSRSGTSGSLQTAYSNPSLSSNTTGSSSSTTTQAGPANVQRWNVKLKKDTPMLGKRDATVTIVEFSDFQ